jgi:hypothetical protein
MRWTVAASAASRRSARVTVPREELSVKGVVFNTVEHVVTTAHGAAR